MMYRVQTVAHQLDSTKVWCVPYVQNIHAVNMFLATFSNWRMYIQLKQQSLHADRCRRTFKSTLEHVFVS